MTKEKVYYWLKLSEGFFREPELKKLRRLPGGDVHTIIYQKLMLLSLETAGELYYEGIDDDMASELALKIDEDPDSIRMVLSFLERVYLIDYLNDDRTIIQMNQVPELIGHETDAARRKRKSRLKETSNSAITACDNVTNVSQAVTKMIDIKDIYTDTDDDISSIITYHNELGIYKERKSDKFTKKIKTALIKISKEDAASLITYAADRYHNGEYTRGFIPRLGWLMGDGLNETLEKMKKNKKGFGFSGVQNYDIATIEEELRAN